MPIPWTEDLSVNVKEIDDQHKYFLSLLNELYISLYSSKIDENIRIIVHNLETYAKMHFETEEKYFDMFNFEGAEEHKLKHRELLNKVRELTQQNEKHGSDILVQLMDFMEDWLVDHLSSMDKKYVKCFNDHGLL